MARGKLEEGKERLLSFQSQELRGNLDREADSRQGARKKEEEQKIPPTTNTHTHIFIFFWFFNKRNEKAEKSCI